jgi:hypothetical protein
MKTFILIILGSIAFRFFYAHGNAMLIKYHSLSSVSDLATGAIIAYLACNEKVIRWFEELKRRWIIFVYIALLILVPMRLYTWKFGIYYNHVSSLTPLVFSSIFAFIIMEQNYAKRSLYKLKNFKLISSWGRFTYAMYCYHMIIFFGVMLAFYLMGINLNGMSKYTFLAVVFISFVSTLFVSEFSYYYFESIFLRWKTRFEFIHKE